MVTEQRALFQGEKGRRPAARVDGNATYIVGLERNRLDRSRCGRHLNIDESGRTIRNTGHEVRVRLVANRGNVPAFLWSRRYYRRRLERSFHDVKKNSVKRFISQA
ncbi:hypothetical protein MSG28_000031 [Choristoneura fumiferana]|uniref:Uncharacterized protein n=1 Tax=Choristoneura fumiferana TaxID=7141 RepID=A0ACC0JYX4_CHOFU|nr:hypothetical protein MSG28_000031 [Choristoneura fumiferana]